MKIQYVGAQPRHRERLYKTGAVFNGPGDVQEIADEAAARKMLAKHPDQYAEFQEGIAGRVDGKSQKHETPEELLTPVGGLSLVKTETQDSKQPPLEGEGGEAKTDAVGQNDIDAIIINGEPIKLEDASRDYLSDVAQKYYGVNLGARTGKADMVAAVAKLIAERGQPKAEV